MEVIYKPSFVREFKKLSRALQEEVVEKIELFKSAANHRSLKVHKLKGVLLGTLSFSVNYRYRIIFEWKEPNKSVRFLGVGDHDIYD